MRNAVRIAPGVLVLCLLLLGGCKREATPAPLTVTNRSMAMAAAPSPVDRRIAISHSFAVELPSDAVATAQQRNLSDCLAVRCTVLASNIDRLRNGVVQASISIRIAPDGFAAFAAAVTAPPATLVSHTETAEDKTLPLLDIEKRLDAQTALRDRLSHMLGQAGTSVADLVAVEKQLADVQGSIESETAQRDYLRTITDSVKVDVAYNGLVQQAGPLDISPVRLALDGFAGNVIESFGDLITMFAVALPWLPLAALAGWLLYWLMRRRFS